MPHAPALPPADRVFARIDRFSCECPSCGEIILSWHGDRQAPSRAALLASQRGAGRSKVTRRSARALTYNPLSQRLQCPWCGIKYVVGLLLYPTTNRGSQPVLIPPDTMPTRRQLLQLRRFAQGFWLNRQLQNGLPVNQAIDNPCICPQPSGWAVACPIHGDPVQHAPTQSS